MAVDFDRLKTQRVLLISGLFDAEFYLETYADIRNAGVDPLAHYVMQGEAEGRSPNPVFFPPYYRRHAMAGVVPERNALAHYIEEGERLGWKPNSAFDPRAYLAANPKLAEFVDRPLFHFLRIGRPAGLPLAPGETGEPLRRVLQAQPHASNFELSGRRNHYELMRYKQVLINELGIEVGFAVYRDAFGLPDSDRIERKPIVSLYEFAREHGAAFHEIAPAGERFIVAPPSVIGEGNHRTLEGVARSMFVACLIDVRVRARSAVIEADDMALLDYEGAELARMDQQLDFDPAVFHSTDDAVWLTTPADERVIELDEAFTLLGVYTASFGHWMWEYLPKFIAATSSGALPSVPVLIDEAMPHTHRQCLEMMLPKDREIIVLRPFATACVRRLWCAPSPMYSGILETVNERYRWEYFIPSPARFAAIIHEMSRRIGQSSAIATGQERVFLARKEFRHRKLVNAPAIEAVAEARGFDIVYVEDLDFADQVRLLRHARLVIAPNGSALVLAFFAQPGTKLVVLNHPFTVEILDVTAVLREIGIDVTIFVGDYVQEHDEFPHFADFEIDEGQFRDFLEAWLPNQAHTIEDAEESVSHATLFELIRFKEALAVSGWMLFELMRFKRALVARFGVQRGFAMYQRALHLPEAAEIEPKPVTQRDRIWQKPLKSLKQIAEERGEIFVEIDPAGTPFAAPPPKIIGDSNSRLLEGVTRSIFVACLKNVRLHGRSAFIELDDVVLLEYQSEDLIHSDDHLDFDPAIFHHTTEDAWVITPENDDDLLELDAAFTLMGPHTHDFGHWMWEYLPKYIKAERAGALPKIPILIDEAMPKSHRQALDLMVPQGVDIISVPSDKIVRVGQLWCASAEFYLPLHEERTNRIKIDDYAAPPARFAGIVREIARRADRKIGGDRVYLGRQSWRRRKLLNHVSIEAIAKARGFQVIYPDEFDFEAQVSLLRTARYVMGPDGSAFYLAFFCRPGTKVCILSNPFTLFTQAEQTILLSGAGIDVTIITGPNVPLDPEYPDFDDFTIDEQHFRCFLDEWVPADRN